MSEKSNIKKLVSSAKKGNQQAFNTLYDLTKNAVYYTCSSLLKNSEDVQDLCQEVFLTVFQKLNTLDNEENFCGWVKQIAVHKCFNFNRGKVGYQIEDEVLTNEVETNEVMLPEEYITNNSKREIILQLMSDTLTHSQYVTVFLFYFDELSISEISEVLEVSEGTVKSRLNSSRKKMKTAIEKYEEENNDKLHGVVFVPLFGSIFKEEAKNLTVPKIDLVLPKQGSDSIASIGAESAVKTASKGLISSVAKTRVIAMLCGMTLLCGATFSTGVLAGCTEEDLPFTTTTSTVEVTTDPTEPTETVPQAVAEAVKENNLKVDSDGNITDSEGNKLKVNENGEVEVKNSDGTTTTIKATEVKDVVQNNGVVSTPTVKATEPKETTKATTKATQPTTRKPSVQPTTKKPSVQPTTKKPATPTPTQKPTQKPTVKPTQAPTQKPTEKVWHPAVTKKVWVVDKASYTYEEPVYETVRKSICNTCGAYLSDMSESEQLAHMKNHAMNGENDSYTIKNVQVKVGTKTVTVPEEGHWETVVVKEGYWEYK